MKKSLIIITLLLIGLGNANAQKRKTQTGVTGNPNRAISRNLADLTFDLIPILLGGGYGFEKVKGFPNKIKVSSSFIVKNIGFISSKPCKVYAIINYQRPRTRSEIEQGVPADAWLGYNLSEAVQLSTIQNGKEILEKKIFYFSNIPADAWEKRIKFLLKIEFDNPNDEVTYSNNLSAPNEFDLINY